jgi:hypothetical protein
MDRESFEENKARREIGMRTIFNFVRGLLWLAVGLFFLNHERFGLEGSFNPTLSLVFGVACLCYGLYRIWVGIRSRSNQE